MNDLFLQTAGDIAKRILSEAHELDDGSLTWNRGYGLDFQPVDDAGIFNGRIGEAIFFAALFAATQNPIYERAALKIVTPLRSFLEEPAQATQLARRIGLGLTGVGSVIYAFVLIASFLKRPELLLPAGNAARAIIPELVCADTKNDVFFGSAGAILGILSLGKHEYVDAATVCADHLLSKRLQDSVSGLRAWGQADLGPETGFAHGSSGIAYALLRLFSVVPDNRYYDAAIEAFAFERHLFRPDISDWLDHRGSSPERVLSSWCHGAVGVGFSRLGALPVMRPDDQSAILEDLRLALVKASTFPINTRKGNDSLCCGQFGRVDFLLEAGRKLRNPSLMAAARTRADTRIAFLVDANFEMPATGEAIQLAPGLWQGLTGIGYTIARLEKPDTLPSLLLWE